MKLFTLFKKLIISLLT